VLKIVPGFIVFIIFGTFFCGCGVKNTSTEEKARTAYNTCVSMPVTEEEHFQAVFGKEEIPEDIKAEMIGVTIHENSRVTFDDLSYLTLTYVGYDEESHIGNMIVDKELGDEVLAIFKELYEAGFPIESVEPAYKYDGDDSRSMENNNTSAFNDRPLTGGNSLSYHQLGRAIDINPYVNPYVKASKGIILPASAKAYADRGINEKGMIKADGICVEIFKKYGWSWGGDWKSLKDYQHFEKR